MGRAGRGWPLGHAGSVHVRERHAAPVRRQLWLAVLHGQPAGVPRSDRGRQPAHHERCRVRHRRPGGQPDQRLVRLQEPRQRLAEQHRPHDPAAHHGHGQGRRHGARAERLVQPRQHERRQRLPGVRPSDRRQQRPGLRLRADPEVPVHHRLGRDRVQRPGLPLRRQGDRQLGPLARVLGRPLVPQRLRQQLGQARAAARSRDGGQWWAAGLRGQLPRRPAVGRELHGLEVRSGRRALRPGLRGLLLHREQRGSVQDHLHGWLRHAGSRPAVEGDHDRARGGVLARRDRWRPLRVGLRRRHSGVERREPAPSVRDGGHLHRQADGDLRRRREGQQDDERDGRQRRFGADGDRADQRRHARRPLHRAGGVHRARDRRHRRLRRRVDRASRRRWRVDPCGQHGQRGSVRDQVHGQRHRHPHGRVPRP